MPVDVDIARREAVTDAVRATGRIEAVQAIDLRPDEQGRITELLFREGQTVAAGTPLVKIDDAMLLAQAERATADRDLATAAARARRAGYAPTTPRRPRTSSGPRRRAQRRRGGSRCSNCRSSAPPCARRSAAWSGSAS